MDTKVEHLIKDNLMHIIHFNMHEFLKHDVNKRLGIFFYPPDGRRFKKMDLPHTTQ